MMNLAYSNISAKIKGSTAASLGILTGKRSNRSFGDIRNNIMPLINRVVHMQKRPLISNSRKKTISRIFGKKLGHNPEC